MKRDTVNYVAVGSFVLACMAGLMVLLLRLSGGGTAPATYHVRYQNVHGIIGGTPVFYHGYKVGQVEAVHPLTGGDGGGFQIDLSVASTQQIPDDSIAHVTESGLLGSVSIDIRSSGSSRLLQPGGQLTGVDRSNLLSAINATADEYRQLSQQQLRPFMIKLNQRINAIGDTIETGSRSLLREFHQLTASLNRSAASLEHILGQQNRDHLSNTLSKLDSFSGQAVSLARELGHTNRALGAAIGHADSVLQNADGVILDNRANLKAAMQDLRNTLHVVSEKIESITYHLDGTSRNLHEFSRQVRQNPGLLLGSTPPTGRR